MFLNKRELLHVFYAFPPGLRGSICLPLGPSLSNDALERCVS